MNLSLTIQDSSVSLKQRGLECQRVMNEELILFVPEKQRAESWEST